VISRLRLGGINLLCIAYLLRFSECAEGAFWCRFMMVRGLMRFSEWCKDEGNDEKLADRTVIDMIAEIPLDYDCIECRKQCKYAFNMTWLLMICK
jgi:hypothetical protein